MVAFSPIESCERLRWDGIVDKLLFRLILNKDNNPMFGIQIMNGYNENV